MATVYNTVTGRITGILSAPIELIPEIIELGSSFLLDDFDSEHYYVVEAIGVIRESQPTILDKLTLTADGIDTITISNAPNGVFTATNTVTRETVSGAINGTDTFATMIVGSYSIKVESFPYLDLTATIEAI